MAQPQLSGLQTKDEILGLPSTPAISPSYPAGPYRFKNREYFIIMYETDPAALRRVVPKPLVPASNIVLYEWIAMPDSSGFGSYEESGTVIPCLFEGKEVNYTAQMFLDCEPPIAAGREIWGFPKKYAQPKLRVESDTLIGVLEYGGQQIATGSMSYKTNPLIAADCVKALGKTSVNLKIIPGVDFQNSICQLVAYNIQDIEIIECWQGQARLDLKAHANASTAELPIRKIIGAKHIKANLTLPYGYVLYDYLKHANASLPVSADELTEANVLTGGNREYLVIRYETDAAAVLPLLPYNVSLPSYGAHAVLTWIKTEGSGLGSYSKAMLHVPVIFQGEEYNYSILAVVDSSAPRCFGREVFGQPQKFGYPSLKVNNDTLEASLKHGSQTVVEASMSYKYQRLFPEKAILALASKELNLKLIPGVDGKPAIAQLVAVQYNDVSVNEAWSGKARLNLHPHVASPFADFSIKKMVSAHHVHADLSLPAGKVLFDYLT